MARTMKNSKLWLMAIIVIGSAIELIQAAAIGSVVTSDGIPANPVAYKRWVRRRPSPHDPNLSVYEVRHVYFVRRTTTPKPKPVIELSDDEMDRQIRCDFQPNLPECKTIQTGPSSSSSTTTTSTTTTTTTPQPPPATTSVVASSTTASITTTSDLPFLPKLPDETTTSSTTSTSTTTSTTPSTITTTTFDPSSLLDDDYALPPEDENYDDTDLDEDIDDENDDEDGHREAEDYLNPGSSIGNNDTEIDETDKNL